ncbi:hypothetical protein KCP69_10270 [Salmonella enterica subsp. enterica]|nr:hypothetical protein KCP69_10270 [Salmonella enterica subsp. enterica]
MRITSLMELMSSSPKQPGPAGNPRASLSTNPAWFLRRAGRRAAKTDDPPGMT